MRRLRPRRRGRQRGLPGAPETLLARDYEDAAFFAVHRMFVDSYSLQHPDRYCRSAKSLAAHLVGLGMILEEGISAASGASALRNWLDGVRELEKPPLPEARGAITLGDVEAIAEPGPWREAVRAWAESTWKAFAGLQPLARRWAKEASGRKPPG